MSSLFPIILVKLALYVPSNARVFVQKYSSYVRFINLCSFGLKNALSCFEEIPIK